MSSHDSVIEKIRTEIERRGWSYRRLADRSLLSESVIYRLFKGNYTHKTVRKIESALEINVLEQPSPPSERADDALGGYLRELYGHYEGEYMFIRPSLSDEINFNGYPMEIVWSSKPRGLCFKDMNKGYEQEGMIHVSDGTPIIHLITLDWGSARMMTAYHMAPNEECIRGLMLTLANPRGRLLFPAACPFIIHQVNEKVSSLVKQNGLLQLEEQQRKYLEKIFEEIEMDTRFFSISSGKSK